MTQRTDVSDAVEPQRGEFDEVKERLEEIARAVNDESLSLDDALDLYEEAVSLGMRASDLLEVGVEGEVQLDRLEDGDPRPNSSEAEATRRSDVGSQPEGDRGEGEPTQG